VDMVIARYGYHARVQADPETTEASKPPPESDAATAHYDAMDAEERRASQERYLWRESPERRRWFRNSAIVLLSLAIPLFALAIVVGFKLSAYRSAAPGRNPTLILLAFGTLAGVTILAVSIFVAFYTQTTRQAFLDRLNLGLVSELQQQERDLADKGTDFDSLWAITQKRIDVYHEIATRQSRNSFRSAQIAAYVGFLFLIAVAIFAGFSNSGTGAIAASVIGLAGAGMSAYIGSTFMKAQTSSSEQLGAYFFQPVEFARALAAERLLDKVEPGDRGKIVERIVQSMTPIRDEQPKS